MKGAIGNAFILNIVITFMLIFFSLLIGSMAYSKAYKTKNYILNLVDKYESAGKRDFYLENRENGKEFENEANEYLGRIGYPINQSDEGGCPARENYVVYKDNDNGYDYCIYIRRHITPGDNNQIVMDKYNYMVLVYMKFDFPVIGSFLRLPITGETKAYTILR